jgi:hypothetical protein
MDESINGMDYRFSKHLYIPFLQDQAIVNEIENSSSEY